MSRFRLCACVILAAGLVSCSSTKSNILAEGPDCRPLHAKVTLTCWYDGKDQPLSQCEVGSEEPAGCDIGPNAVAYFNSGLDVTDTYQIRGGPDRPRWIQIDVYRDTDGRVGRLLFDSQSTRFLRVEKTFYPQP